MWRAAVRWRQPTGKRISERASEHSVCVCVCVYVRTYVRVVTDVETASTRAAETTIFVAR